jgi:hypothetical protein
VQPFRFLLYCLSTVAGIYGLLLSIGPAISAAVQGHFSEFSSDESLFHIAVIFLLSLILLILVHLGHRLAKAFDVGPARNTAPEDLEKKLEAASK